MNDEISLFDLWEILRRRRLTILLTLLATLVAAGGYLLGKEPLYDMEMVIEVGQVPNAVGTIMDASQEVRPGDGVQGLRFLETPSAVATRLNEVLVPQARGTESELSLQGESADGSSAAGKALHDYPSITVSIIDPDSGLIALRSEARLTDLERVESLMRVMADALIEEHSRYWQSSKAWIDAQVTQLEGRLERLGGETDIAAIETEILAEVLGQPGADRSVAIVSMLSDVIVSALSRELEHSRWDIEDRLAALELAQAKMTPTTIQRTPSVSDRPVGPKTGLVLVLSVVLGLMLGVFAAFFREFIVKAREYRRQLDADSLPAEQSVQDP